MFLEPDFEASTAANTPPIVYSTAVTKTVDAVAGSQRFFPLFSVYNNGNPPLGHSRPFVYNQEGAYSHRPYSARTNLNFDNNFRGFDDAFDHGKGHDGGRGSSAAGLLGSGNFGVIRGGTFYNDNDDISEYAGSNHHVFNPYYNQNGHGRPASYYINPKPVKHEQFANFRDFADINTPSNSAYSQYVIVYANKNATRNPEDLTGLRNILSPNNINERLEMLDQELLTPTTTELPEKKVKLSASKSKLALLLPEKKVWNKKKIEMHAKTMESQKDLYEPLLALS